MPTVDPEPWFRRQRDERIRELEQQRKSAGADDKAIRKAIRRAKWDYRRALWTRGRHLW